MIQFDRPGELHTFLREKKQLGASVGFIPTMGALHEGHLSMVRRSVTENDLTVVSIFVNPIQFNNPADLEKYPRNLERDISQLDCARCDILFTPGVADMYPPGEVLQEIDLNGLDRVMEGKFRPGHFRGVAIVVRKLFETVEPHVAYFGKKDFQQLVIIRHMVKSLDLPVRIIPIETARESDGLAMSSRNLRLTPEDRALAPKIHEVLQWTRSQAGNIPPRELERLALARLKAVRGLDPEYFEIVNAVTLLPVTDWQQNAPAVACTAVNINNIRLIDNLEVFC